MDDLRRRRHCSSGPLLIFDQELTRSCQMMVSPIERWEERLDSMLFTGVQVFITASVRQGVIAGYDASNMP
jgi:hypothetical protein